MAIALTRKAVCDMKIETELTERQQLIYNLISEDLHISVKQIALKLNDTRRTILREIQEMKKKIFLMCDKKVSIWEIGSDREVTRK